ncbi:MAG: hypothetical protein V4739_01950 [Pseudomonadota bacterium]
MRSFILWLSLSAAALFGTAFALSYLNPLLIERAARELVRLEVERRVGEKVGSLTDSRVVLLAQKALGATDAQVAAAKRALAAEVPQKVALAMADLLRADCECRKRLVERATQAHEKELGGLIQVRERLQSLIETAYQSVTAQLFREFRIFTACNGLAFALLAVVTWWRRAAAWQLVLPALVLVSATTLTAGLYLFGQNWLHTVVFGDYLGLYYVAYLGLAVLLMSDVVFNRARVCTQAVNLALNVVGSAAQAVPC